MSRFRVAPGFKAALDTRRRGIEDAANAGMQQVMELAAEDARRLRRWRDPGYYDERDRFGDLWTWRVTGASEASITAYVVPHKNLPSLNPGLRTTITRVGNGGAKAYRHEHHTDADVTGDHREEAGKVKGVVTMFTHYAPFLQLKELNGGAWGQPSPGNPVTVEVLEVYWDTVYIPMIERVMAARMRRFS